MLPRSFKKLTTFVRIMQEKLDLSEGNPGRCKRAWECLCEMVQKVRAWLCREWRRIWNVKRHQILGLKPHLPKNRPSVPVHISSVPVHFSHCPFFRRVYRYTLMVYRYTLPIVHFLVSCTGTLCPFFFSSFSFSFFF